MMFTRGIQRLQLFGLPLLCAAACVSGRCAPWPLLAWPLAVPLCGHVKPPWPTPRARFSARLRRAACAAGGAALLAAGGARLMLTVCAFWAPTGAWVRALCLIGGMLLGQALGCALIQKPSRSPWAWGVPLSAMLAVFLKW